MSCKFLNDQEIEGLRLPAFLADRVLGLSIAEKRYQTRRVFSESQFLMIEAPLYRARPRVTYAQYS